MATTLDAISNHTDIEFLSELILYGGSIPLWHDSREAAAIWVTPSTIDLAFAPVPAILRREHYIHTFQEQMERIYWSVLAQDLECAMARIRRGRPWMVS